MNGFTLLTPHALAELPYVRWEIEASQGAQKSGPIQEMLKCIQAPKKDKKEDVSRSPAPVWICIYYSD